MKEFDFLQIAYDLMEVIEESIGERCRFKNNDQMITQQEVLRVEEFLRSKFEGRTMD